MFSFLVEKSCHVVLSLSGHVWAHHCCAEWSDGVTQNEDGVLKVVDKAVVSGLSKVKVAFIA